MVVIHHSAGLDLDRPNPELGKAAGSTGNDWLSGQGTTGTCQEHQALGRLDGDYASCPGCSSLGLPGYGGGIRGGWFGASPRPERRAGSSLRTSSGSSGRSGTYRRPSKLAPLPRCSRPVRCGLEPTAPCAVRPTARSEEEVAAKACAQAHHHSGTGPKAHAFPVALLKRAHQSPNQSLCKAAPPRRRSRRRPYGWVTRSTQRQSGLSGCLRTPGREACSPLGRRR